MSRERELLADRTAAHLTSHETTALALVNFNVVHKAFQLGLAEALRTHAPNPFNVPLGSSIREKLVPRADFWTELIERKTRHSLDSHPPLHVRLTALG
jgi:Zn-dependent protease with chaperone function